MNELLIVALAWWLVDTCQMWQLTIVSYIHNQSAAAEWNESTNGIIAGSGTPKKQQSTRNLFIIIHYIHGSSCMLATGQYNEYIDIRAWFPATRGLRAFSESRLYIPPSSCCFIHLAGPWGNKVSYGWVGRRKEKPLSVVACTSVLVILSKLTGCGEGLAVKLALPLFGSVRTWPALMRNSYSWMNGRELMWRLYS